MAKANPPKVLEYAQRFYEHLESHCEDQLYRGFITREYKNMGLPMGHYSRVKLILEEMGCITVEKVGKRSIPSEWWLIGAPTQKQYDSTEFTWDETKYGKLVQRIEVLEQQMKGILNNGEGT